MNQPSSPPPSNTARGLHQQREGVPGGAQQARQIEILQERYVAPGPEPELACIVVRAVGEVQVLRTRQSLLDEPQRDEAAPPFGVNHELAAHGDAQWSRAVHHLPRQRTRESCDIAALDGDPRGNVEMPPGGREEDLAE